MPLRIVLPFGHHATVEELIPLSAGRGRWEVVVQGGLTVDVVGDSRVLAGLDPGLLVGAIREAVFEQFVMIGPPDPDRPAERRLAYLERRHWPPRAH